MPASSATYSDFTLGNDSPVQLDAGVAANRKRVRLINGSAGRIYIGNSSAELAGTNPPPNADFIEANGGIREFDWGSAVQVWARRPTGTSVSGRLVNEFT